MKTSAVSRPFFLLILLGMTITFISISSMFFACYAQENAGAIQPVFGAQTKTLPNGLRVITIPNHRAPVVTHMLWIGAGAADEPESVGGAAHFLEHLMFKGTPAVPPGDYSKKIRAVGGDDNAFTAQDYTAYFVTLPPDQLPLLMELERDRFLNLSPPRTHIESEKQVIIEERRQRTENDPLGPLYEQLNAYLFASTPYAKPVIGWMADMQRLTYNDVIAFKNKWYKANNMILILSGDIMPQAAFDLAQKYYGDFPKGDIGSHQYLSPPNHPARTTLTWTTDKIAESQLVMGWRTPSYAQDAKTGRILDILQEVLSGGASTRLYQDLVVKQKIATSISLNYDGDTRSGAALWLSAVPAPKVNLKTLEKAIFTTLAHAEKTITPAEVRAAITRRGRGAAFARDSVAGPAMIIGQALTTGQTLEDVETWPAQLSHVTADEVKTLLKNTLLCTDTTPACPQPVVAYIIAQTPGKGVPATALPPYKGMMP